MPKYPIMLYALGDSLRPTATSAVAAAAEVRTQTPQSYDDGLALNNFVREFAPTPAPAERRAKFHRQVPFCVKKSTRALCARDFFIVVGDAIFPALCGAEQVRMLQRGLRVVRHSEAPILPRAVSGTRDAHALLSRNVRRPYIVFLRLPDDFLQREKEVFSWCAGAGAGARVRAHALCRLQERLVGTSRVAAAHAAAHASPEHPKRAHTHTTPLLPSLVRKDVARARYNLYARARRRDSFFSLSTLSR